MFPFKKNSVIVATVATTLSGIRLCNRMVHCSEERTQQKPQGPKFVAMFLSPDSQAVLGRFLDKQGIGALKGNRVVIRRLVEDDDSFAYQPLFGERAAFRLKGIVETENGIRSATGRVSIMSGPLEDENCVVSLPLFENEANISTLQESIDLPTRLNLVDVVRGKPIWKGRIRAVKVLDQAYGATKASFRSVGKENQIVIDGTICSSDWVDEKGNCLFDRKTLALTLEADGTAGAATEVGIDEERTVDAKGECPVCRFMKAGPCGAEFIAWDKCIEDLTDKDELSKCFSKTVEMMRCMKSNEYYDIMTAGTDEKMAALETTVDNTSSSDSSGSSSGSSADAAARTEKGSASATS